MPITKEQTGGGESVHYSRQDNEKLVIGPFGASNCLGNEPPVHVDGTASPAVLQWSPDCGYDYQPVRLEDLHLMMDPASPLGETRLMGPAERLANPSWLKVHSLQAAKDYSLKLANGNAVPKAGKLDR